MKRAVKVISLCLVLVLFALMAMASGGSDSTAKTDITSSSGEKADSSGSSAKTEVELPAIEEQVILDMNGVKVTAKEYVSDGFWGDGIKVLVENDSAQNVGVGCDALIVNNYMISDLFSCSVAPGKKANDTIYISSSALKNAGIENIGQIELYLHLFDGDTYMTIADAPCATIKTSFYDKMDTVPNDAGKVLFENGGIKIVGKYVSDDTIFGKAIVLYIENNSGENVTVQCEDMSINGFMMSPLFSSTVYNGKMAISDITLLSSELEENDITDVDEVELSFHIFNAETYSTIMDSSPITFSTK